MESNIASQLVAFVKHPITYPAFLQHIQNKIEHHRNQIEYASNMEELCFHKGALSELRHLYKLRETVESKDR